MAESEIRHLAARLSQQPESPLFARLADFYLAGDRAGEALALCERGVKEHPSYAGGHIVLGKCLTRAGRVREARSAFHEALNLAPYNTVVQNLLISLPDVKEEEPEIIAAPTVAAIAPVFMVEEKPAASEPSAAPEPPAAPAPAPEMPEPPQQPTTSMDAEAARPAQEPQEIVSAAPETAQPLEAVPPPDDASLTSQAEEPQFDPYPTFEEYLSQHPAPESVMTLEQYLKGRAAGASSSSTSVPGEAPAQSAETPTDFESIARRLQNAGRIVPVDRALPPSSSSPASAPSDAASGTQSSTIVTQTMAEIYAAQNEFQAAIDAYEELIKKQPEQAKAFQQRIDSIRLLMGTV